MEELIPVRFKFGTYAEYKALSSTEVGVLYYIIDRGLIFREGNIVTQNLDVSAFIDSSGYECIRLSDNTTYPNISTYDIYQCSAMQNVMEDYIGDSSAMRFMGKITDSSQIPYIFRTGDVYLINRSGFYLGQYCRPGDMIVATESNVWGTSENPNMLWNIVQRNLEGAVTVKQDENWDWEQYPNGYTLDSSCVVIGDGMRKVRKVKHPDKPDATYVLGMNDSLEPEWRTIEDLDIIDSSSWILKDSIFIDSSTYTSLDYDYPYQRIYFVNISDFFYYKKIDTSLSLTIANNLTADCRITVYGMFGLFTGEYDAKLVMYPDSAFSTEVDFTPSKGWMQNIHISGLFNNDLYKDNNINPSFFTLMIGIVSDDPDCDIRIIEKSENYPPIKNTSQLIVRGYIKAHPQNEEQDEEQDET